MPPGLMAQGLPVTSQGGVQGVMGRGGNFQALGESALARLGRPPMPPPSPDMAPVSPPFPGGSAVGLAGNPVDIPTGPLMDEPMTALGGMNKPSLADLYGPRGMSPGAPGAPNFPAGRPPMPPPFLGPPGPPGGGVMGASGPPANPPRRPRSVSMPSQEKPQPKPRRPIQGTEKPNR